MKKHLFCLAVAALAVPAAVAAVQLTASIYDDTLGRAYSGSDAAIEVSYTSWQAQEQKEGSGSLTVTIGEYGGYSYGIVRGRIQGEALDPTRCTWVVRDNSNLGFGVQENTADLANGFLTNRVVGVMGASSGTYGSASVVLHVVHASRTLTYASEGDGISNLPEPETFTGGVETTLSVEEPVRPGYVFRGWTRASTGRSVEYYPGATVTFSSDTTLYALWEANSYSVAFNANGGTGSMPSQVFVYGTPKALATNAFTRTGYSFLGWATTSGGEAEYADGATLSTLTTEASATLYAVWTATAYVLTVDPNGGSYQGSSEATGLTPAIPYDSKQWNSIGIASRTGYALRGYFADRAGETRVYDAEGKNVSAGGYWSTAYPNGTWRYPSDLKVFALWRAITYTIAFNANGGAGTSTLADIQLAYDESLALPANVYSRAGYDFAGWSTNAAASAAAYTDRETVSNLAAEDGAVVTLHAVWRPHVYTVAFDANGGEGEMTELGNIQYGEERELPANAFSRTGYAFLGWARSATAREAEFADGATIGNLTEAAGGSVTLHAVWKPHVYTIAFSANGGSQEMADQAATYDVPVQLTPNGFVRTGYAFGGWALEEDGAAVFADGATVTNLTAADGGTVALYAFWEAGRYTIDYDANGGTGEMAPTTNVAYGARADLATNAFSRAGHTFRRWRADDGREYADGATVSNLTAESGATVTMHAVWDPHAYTIVYDANGGSGEMASQRVCYGAAAKLSTNAFSRAGHTFREWRAAGGADYADGASVSNLTAVAGGTVRLYAQWQADEVTVTFDKNGGGGTADGTTVGYGLPYGDLPDALTREGFAFDGWETADGEDVTKDTLVDAAGAITLRARWTTNAYTVVYDANGGERWTEPFEKIVRHGEAFALPSNTYVRAGYVFAGWDAGGVLYAGGESVSNLTATADGLVTMAAQWTPIHYTVVLDGNGGTNTTGQAVVTNELDYGDSLALPAFSRAGRLFQSWRRGSSTHLDGAAISNLTTTADATVTMTAQWGLDSNDLSDALDIESLAFVDDLDAWKVIDDGAAENGACLALRGADLTADVVLETETDSAGTLSFKWKFAVVDNGFPPSGSFSVQLRDLTADCALWVTNFSGETAYASYTYDPHWEREEVALVADGSHLLQWQISLPNSLGAAEGLLLDHVTWEPAGGAAGASAVAPPEGVGGLVEDGTEQTGVAAADGFSLSGNKATAAGGYLATAVLADKTGSVWADGTTADRTIPWRIAEAPRDLSGVKFADGEFTADGSQKSLAVSGAPEDLVDVTYEGNGRTEIGSYRVTAWIWKKNTDIALTNLTANLTIVAQEVEIPPAVAGLVYDGGAKTGVVAAAGYTLAGSVATDAGDYIATATLGVGCRWTDGSRTEKEIPWSIARARYDMSGVAFEGGTIEFDDASHALVCPTNALPEGVSVLDYVNNDKTGPGTYTVRVRFVGDANHEPIDDMTATLTINARRIAVPVAVDNLVYTGEALTGVAPSPDGDYTISGNVETNAGTHWATVKLAKTGCVWADSNMAGSREIKWEIARKAYDMSGVKFEDLSVEADGTPKGITISGALPAGVDVTYDGNGKTEPGSYTVTAKFTGDAVNYEPIADMTATLTITQKVEPSPVDPTPVDPTPVDPTPVDPTPVDPTPVDPTPVDPTPVDPTPVDPTPVDPTPVDPTPDDSALVLFPDGVAALGAFTAEKAGAFNGWLKDKNGAIVALLTVKTTAAKAGRESKATIAVTPIGGKKTTKRTSFLPGGNPTDEHGIVYGARGLLGTFDGYEVEAGVDVYKSKIPAIKALESRIPVGVHTFAIETANGPAVFSASVAKTGKTKVQGYLGDGTKISVSPTGSLGTNHFAVPVVLSKKTATFGFVFWIPLKSGTPSVANLSRADWTASQAGGAIALSDGAHVFDFEMPAFRSYLQTVDGFDVAPAPAPFTVSGKKWDAGRTSGRLKMVDGVPAITGTTAPLNLSSLKLSYTATTGLVKGSFKLYYLDGGRIRNEKATIVGAVVDGRLIGCATIRKTGSFEVVAE